MKNAIIQFRKLFKICLIKESIIKNRKTQYKLFINYVLIHHTEN